MQSPNSFGTKLRTVQTMTSSTKSHCSWQSVDVEACIPGCIENQQLTGAWRYFKQEAGPTVTEIIANRHCCPAAEQNNPVLVALAAKHADHARVAERDVLDAKDDEFGNADAR